MNKKRTWTPEKVFLLGLVVIALVICVSMLSACGESRQDAPVTGRDTGPADLINMPDGFSNVAHKCDGPNMVYVIYHGAGANASPYGSVAIAPNDPRCASTPK